MSATSPSQQQTPIYVVDDDEVSRDTLTTFLKSLGYRTRAWSDGRPFLRAAGSLAPACVLASFDMARTAGVDLQKELRSIRTDMQLVFFAETPDLAAAVRAIRSGAVHFMLRPIEPDELSATIEEAVGLLDSESHTARHHESLKKIAPLTEREREVLRGLCAGLPNKSIAYDLALSPRTIEVHRASIMRKLEADNLAELFRIAFTAGF